LRAELRSGKMPLVRRCGILPHFAIVAPKLAPRSLAAQYVARLPSPFFNRLSRDMQHRIGYVALIVRDYDEAIDFYTQTLGFDLIEDTDLGSGKRWVLVAPPAPSGAGSTPSHSTGTCLLLARAVTPHQESRIGDQTGGRVFLFLHTDDCWRDYRALQSRGVVFEVEPRLESYGIVAAFSDLYANRWDLLQLFEKL
jgi:catechol 2,3-dioxygenase-like lactoylglutathione lyase family enzyme